MGCLALPHASPGVQVVKLDNLCSHEAPDGAQIPEESFSVGCDSEEGTPSSSSDLIDRISKGLLVPSQPLSSAAARKLLQRAPHSSFYNGRNSTCSSHDRHWTSAARSTACIATYGPPATAGETNTRTSDPVLLKSLPTELLYDDTGLQLFDQITYLPEYYLTAAEIDILSKFGHDIVGQCVGDGTSVTELGAGSMRKTKLLLDAVVAAGTTDVTFFALDLCEDSLSHALEQLQDHFGSQIRLAGLLGTYQQGLAYIQQQQASGGSSSSSSMSRSTSFHASSTSEVAMINLAATAAAAEQQAGSSSRHLTPAGPEEDQTDRSSDTSGAQDSAGDDSSLEQDSSDNKTVSGGSTLSTDDVTVLLTDLDVTSCGGGSSRCATAAHESGECTGVVSGSTGSGSSGPGKLILWLGSSIGNYNREEAAGFLTQLRELAMLPGDLLLVGIDRRNNPDKVATAYNDATGVTNAFIMNGLQHCKHVLDAELQNTSAHDAEDANTKLGMPHGVGAKPGPHHNSNASIKPEDFEYFCLYDDELGRHEAYYRATQDTQITVPATAGATTAAAVDCAPCIVDIAAGELIHIEYSHKYSQQEIEDLADKAGLKWVRAWTDSQQQYDLHLFSRGDRMN